MSLLQCNVYRERFHSQTCDLPGMIPGSLCALILSAQKQTNKPTKGKSANPMGIRRGSSQSWAVLSTERGYTVSPDRARSLVSLWWLLEKKPFSSWFPSISWNRKLKTDEGWKRCSVCDSVTRLQICRDDSHRLPWWRLLRAKWSRETYWSRNRCRYECVI